MMTMTASSVSAAASVTGSASVSTSTDCSSSMQGSTTSSASSDVMTLTTTAASSWCAIPASSRLRVLRLVRPHQRRLLVGGPERGSTYGFAVRGGREHGTGFFVSHVEHGGEAQLKGLRIGDQILRINGFRLDDAVHKEFIQLVASQDRVTMKVRGVGMLPVRDQPEERLSWSVVKLPSVSGTPSESSFKAVDRGRGLAGSGGGSRDINVVLHVAPRTKLGLGICKGPEWKPGIFVQFTKERSVAREAGLRPGDQILSVNSIDFSDVLFSEAVAVMKSSSKLDMVVRTAAGCDLFPGESSGYNSSASSVTGDQSPCWADAKSKRLTAVREEAGNGGVAGAVSGNANWSQNVEVHKQMNKTIIKLTENGTSINNTYIASAGFVSGSGSASGSGTVSGSGSSSVSGSSSRSQSVSRSTTMKRTHLRPVNSAGSGSIARSAAASGLVSGSGTGSGAPVPPPPAMIDGTATGGGGINGSSLSSAINEELKKRKEKQQQQRNNNRDRERDGSGITNGNGNGSGHGLHHHRGSISNGSVPHRQRSGVTSPGSDRNNTLGSGGGGGANGGATGGAAGADQHTALMDEFKRAHQRMFRNGFHESEHKERGETLKRTSIMPDDSSYRNSNNSNAFANNALTNNRNSQSRLPQNGAKPANGNGNSANGSPELPPPPPQFANPQPKQLPAKLITGNGTANGSGHGNGNVPGNGSLAKVKQPMSPMRSASISVGGFRPPITPQPDYDAVQLRGNNGNATGSGSGASASLQQQQRRTLRLGTVTIGEYGDQRAGKRETLRKMNGEAGSNGILKNGNQRSSASFNHGTSQHPEKSIKFGN
ncbi:uncharacterized protein [Drosophila bipectinata]|uniref:uncharacterized protein n=1 Tax=Drosophila bipectinata TaxID=42026 RepID=UPI001C890891|nr:putative per-hexamer repeat protein 5 [Drosophila bipectinata]